MFTVTKKGVITVDRRRYTVSASDGSTENNIYQGCVAFGRCVEYEITRGNSLIPIIIGLGDSEDGRIVQFELIKDGKAPLQIVKDL